MDSLINFLKEHWLWVIIALLVYQWAVGVGEANRQKEIDEIREEKADVLAKKAQYEMETIPALQRDIDAANEALKINKAELSQLKESEAAALDRVAELEAEKDVARMSIEEIRDEDRQLEDFVATFPRLSKAGKFGVMDVEVNDVTVPYITMPLTFTDVFKKNKATLDLANEQLKEYGGITEVRKHIDEITAENARLLRTVATNEANKYAACDVLRQDMTNTLLEREDKHIATLQKGRIDLGGWGGFKGGLVGGIVLGGIAGYFVNDAVGGGGCPDTNFIRLQGDF